MIDTVPGTKVLTMPKTATFIILHPGLLITGVGLAWRIAVSPYSNDKLRIKMDFSGLLYLGSEA